VTVQLLLCPPDTAASPSPAGGGRILPDRQMVAGHVLVGVGQVPRVCEGDRAETLAMRPTIDRDAARLAARRHVEAEFERLLT